jgi:leucyl-tRNA synthetase
MHSLDEKWQKKWAEAGVFEPKGGEGEKFFLTAAFPYPNSPQHIGHGRTYTTTDIYARYMRMRGKSVLFPMAFHVTGTPILAMAKRIAEKDEEILGIFEKVYGIPRKTSESLTDPRDLVAYFSREIEAGMLEMGYSIDWRRKFYSYDPQFNRFIEWHFDKLEQAGYIKKGEHPVPWCPVENTAIGAHDTKEDMDPQIEEVTAVLFPFADGFLACSTYRPETVYGVTNIWANPSADYVKARCRGTIYYIAKEALASLSMQLPLEVERELPASELFSGSAKHPLTGEELPILSAGFVDPKHGTGVVMSVPAHAPYDYLALRDAGLEKKVPPKQVLRLEGFGSCPAKEIVERMGVKSQKDPKAEEATAELYKKEAHTGVMAVGEFAGMLGAEAKEKIKEKMAKEGSALLLYEIQNGPVYSRFGGLVGVKIVRDQWFIDYGDEKWKSLARECLSEMGVLPEKTRHEYEYTIGWLRQKACTRSSGLGTHFPLDKSKMIEALSDSTIYTAFYTVAHIAMRMRPEQLTEQLFDYVFLGKPSQGLPEEAEKMRSEFSYWYPLDSRHSATDLVHNHLTFFVFNHAAVFPRENWPRQIVTNGFVLMDGKKMSKSMGNIIPIRAATGQFGADAIRFVVVSGADLSTDTDFNRPAVEGVLSRLRFMQEAIGKYASAPDNGNPGIADRWLLSRMHSRAKAAPAMYESFQLRELSLELLYNSFNDLQWYLKRAEKPKLREFFELWVPLVAPIMPHFAEEMWEKLGRKHYVREAQFVSVAALPHANKSKIDPALEAAEDYILRVREDIFAILRLIKKEKPAKVELFIAAAWKRRLRGIAARERKFDSAMKAAMADDEIKPHAQEVAKVLQNYMKNLPRDFSAVERAAASSTPMKSAGALGGTVGAQFEMEALQSGKKLLEDELSCPVVVMEEEQSGAQKAKAALPGKPAVLVS